MTQKDWAFVHESYRCTKLHLEINQLEVLAKNLV